MVRQKGRGKRAGKNRSGSRPSGRSLRVRVKSARGRKASSTRWLDRQLNDPYVQEARKLGYRSRSAFKLLQLDEKFRLFHPGQKIVDLGAAPGGWTQVVTKRVQPDSGQGMVIAIDIEPMDPVSNAVVFCLDICDPLTPGLIFKTLGGLADVIISDMAAPVTGHKSTDHMRTRVLCEEAHTLAFELLATGGVLVMKAFDGGTHGDLMAAVKKDFDLVRTVKPEASRRESPETYIVATGFRGKR